MTPANPSLIERLEAAEGGSRDLDAEIWYALIEKPRPGDKIDRDMVGRWPAYTTSLDAALALAERCGWRLRTLDHSIPNQPSVRLEGPVKHYPENSGHWPAHDGPAYQCGRGKTRPLAACIAILRAMADGREG